MKKMVMKGNVNERVLANQVVDSLNMSVDCVDRRRLRATGQEVAVASCAGDVLAWLDHENGRSLLMADGCRLFTIEESGGETEPLATLESAPLCAVQASNEVVVMTDLGAVMLERDGAAHRWVFVGGMPELPDVQLLAQRKGELSVGVAGGVLTGTYSGSGRLSMDDNSALKSDYLRAYTTLYGRAASSGLAIQPVIAFYRLLDESGGEVYRSSPVLVSPEGMSCTGDLSIGLESNGLRRGVRLSAETWRLGVKIRGKLTGRWSWKIAKLEVLATPQLTPINYKGLSDGWVNPGGTELTFTPPTMWGEQLVGGALERLGKLAQVVATIPSPFSQAVAGDCTAVREVDLPISVDAEEDWKRMSAALSGGVKPLGAPVRRFSAELASRSGETIVYGNPRVEYDEPHSPQTLAVIDGESGLSGDWTAKVAVEMASGERRVVGVWRGTGGWPKELSPLITYPSSSATSLTIEITAGGDVRGRRVELRAADGMEMAYWIEPGLKPWTPPIRATAMISDESAVGSSEEQPGRVIATQVAHPLNATGTASVSGSALTALTPASRTASAWSFGQSHFYAFAQDGVHSLAVKSAGVLNGSTLIDRRGVGSASRVTLGPTSVYALTEGSIVEIKGNQSKTVVNDIKGVGIGWHNSGCGELWVIGEDGEVSSIDTASGFRSRRHRAERLWSDGNRLLYGDERGLFRPGDRYNRGEMIDMAMAVTVPGNRAEGTLNLNMTASSVEIEIELLAHDHPYSQEEGSLNDGRMRVKRLRARGMMKRPLRIGYRSPRRRYMTLKVSGRVSEDAVIEPITEMRER